MNLQPRNNSFHREDNYHFIENPWIWNFKKVLQMPFVNWKLKYKFFFQIFSIMLKRIRKYKQY